MAYSKETGRNHFLEGLRINKVSGTFRRQINDLNSRERIAFLRFGKLMATTRNIQIKSMISEVFVLVTSATKVAYVFLKKGHSVGLQAEHREHAKLFENGSAMFTVAQRCNNTQGALYWAAEQLTRVLTKQNSICYKALEECVWEIGSRTGLVI